MTCAASLPVPLPRLAPAGEVITNDSLVPSTKGEQGGDLLMQGVIEPHATCFHVVRVTAIEAPERVVHG